MLVASGAPAIAQSAEEEAANVLYTDGKRAFEQGRSAKALELFQKAYEVLQNDFIRYYLGRTHASLGQCEAALNYFGELSRALPAAPREERRKAEVACRLDLATQGLESYRCHEALETLAPISRRLRSPESRRRFSALQSTAKKCTDVFGTRTSLGQEAARYYAEARAALRSGRTTKALKLADKSLASKPSRPAAAVEAIALAKLGRCQVAIGRLETAKVHANPEDAHIMGELNTRCRLSEGKRLLKGGSCYEIIRMLEPLEGKLSPADDLWRRQKINWCRPHATPFPTDTTQKKAAYGLFKAATLSQKEDGEDALLRASELYAKALKLAEEPVIRRALARVQVEVKGCEAALKTLSVLSDEQRGATDRHLIELCEHYAPGSALSATALATRVEGLFEVLALRDAGVYLQAISRLDTFAGDEVPGLMPLRADLLYGAGRCEDYLQEVSAIAEAHRGHITDLQARLKDCQEPVEVAVKPAPPPHATEDSAALAEVSVSHVDLQVTPPRLAPWLTLGTGAALGAAGVAFTAAWLAGRDRYDDARSVFETGSADEALSALEEMNRLEAEGELYSGLALGLGAAGAVALGVGLYLVLNDQLPPSSADGSVLSIYPSVSPRHVGIGGNF